MKLFDLPQNKKFELRRLVNWHLAYIALVALFFSIIYYFDFYKSHTMLRENFIFNFIAPTLTIVFIYVSPWRKEWWQALSQIRNRVEGQLVFMIMAFMVFAFGFYIYGALIWVLGAMVPTFFYV